MKYIDFEKTIILKKLSRYLEVLAIVYKNDVVRRHTNAQMALV
jgi:hypothetical protein